jgi:hypothetical protein
MVLAPPAFLLATQLLIAVADQVPSIDVGPSCRAAATAFGVNQDVGACIQDEKNARDELAKEWNQFSAADRASCTSLVKMGSSGTYTDLITCLEIKRDARRLPKDSGRAGTGAATSGPRSDMPVAPHRQPTQSTVGGGIR